MPTAAKTRTWTEAKGDGWYSWGADDARVTAARSRAESDRWHVTVCQTGADGDWYTVATEIEYTPREALATARRWVKAMTKIRPK